MNFNWWRFWVGRFGKFRERHRLWLFWPQNHSCTNMMWERAICRSSNCDSRLVIREVFLLDPHLLDPTVEFGCRIYCTVPFSSLDDKGYSLSSKVQGTVIKEIFQMPLFRLRQKETKKHGVRIQPPLHLSNLFKTSLNGHLVQTKRFGVAPVTEKRLRLWALIAEKKIWAEGQMAD